MFFNFQQNPKITPLFETAFPETTKPKSKSKKLFFISVPKPLTCDCCGKIVNKLSFYEACYIGDPQKSIDYFNNKKWINNEVCQSCFALLCPEDGF